VLGAIVTGTEAPPVPSAAIALVAAAHQAITVQSTVGNTAQSRLSLGIS
jgi:hypothetical protein